MGSGVDTVGSQTVAGSVIGGSPTKYQQDVSVKFRFQSVPSVMERCLSVIVLIFPLKHNNKFI